MTWIRRYRIRHYLTNSIWIQPTVGMVLALVVAYLVHAVESRLGWESAIDPGTAQAVLATMASAMFTFVVFVSSALLVAVQLASSTLTPRIIGLVYRDPITKHSLTFFVVTFTFTLSALVRIGSTVPTVSAYLAAYACLASLGVFVYLIDHVGKALRPSGALWAAASLGRDVIEHVYPRRVKDRHGGLASEVDERLSMQPYRTVVSHKDGVVLAFDVSGLVSLAEQHNCVVELVPQVGDFVANGDPLFRVYGVGASLSEAALYDSVAVGQERTLEQDPAFVFRIIVDVASKGLSPAINDPTTAVLAIDQIHHLLRDVGQRHLDDERVKDKSGRVRLLYRTPDWVDFVQLAVTEIRQFGGTSIQIARRLRAMLENLIQTLPEDRTPLLRQELSLLRRSAERYFAEPEDRALAEESDLQGVGGKQGRESADRQRRESAPS